MVLLIIIPIKWLAIIGNINPTFSGPIPIVASMTQNKLSSLFVLAHSLILTRLSELSEANGGSVNFCSRWFHVASTRPGKHTKSYWKWSFIVDLPIKNGGSFHSYVKLPEGNVCVSSWHTASCKLHPIPTWEALKILASVGWVVLVLKQGIHVAQQQGARRLDRAVVAGVAVDKRPVICW